jgi:hypothetical protein
MAQYKFVKQFGNKKAGSTYSLLPVAANALLKKGIVEISEVESEVKKPKGRPKKKK